MYEMKFHGRETAIKADPYAMEATRYADAHSVVTKSDVTDKSQAAKSTNTGAAKKKTFAKSVNKGAVSVLEVKLKDIADIIGTDAAYGTIADKLIEYVKAADIHTSRLCLMMECSAIKVTAMRQPATMFHLQSTEVQRTLSSW